jgi:thymidylate kinase
MLIFFAGTDCCGKDTVMHELSKSYNYKYYMSPRSPICNIVYDRIYQRNPEFDQVNLSLISKLLKMGAYFVLIKAKPSILVARAKKRKEKHVNNEKDFKLHIKTYNDSFNTCIKIFDKYKDRFIKVDNSKDINTTVDKLRKKIIL